MVSGRGPRPALSIEVRVRGEQVVNDPIVTTGLFSGRRLSQLPTAYLRLQLELDLRPDLRAAIAAELQRRVGQHVGQRDARKRR